MSCRSSVITIIFSVSSAVGAVGAVGCGAGLGAVAAAGLLALSVACCGWLVVCVLEVLFGAETILAGVLAVALNSGFVPWVAVTPIENSVNMVSVRAGQAGGRGWVG